MEESWLEKSEFFKLVLAWIFSRNLSENNDIF